jgi:hypothetical protein
MAKQSPADATVFAAQQRYENEVQKLVGNWDKLTDHVRVLNALIDLLPAASEPTKLKAPLS